MKKTILTFAIFALLFSCGASHSNPSDVAKAFAQNMADGKIDEAKEYVTEPSKKMLDLVGAFGGGALPTDPNFKFEVLRDSIVENKAWVWHKGEDGEEEQIELHKIDGKWLVSMGKK